MEPFKLLPTLAATIAVVAAAPSLAFAEGGATSPSFSVRVHGVVSPRCSLTKSTGKTSFDHPASASNTARADALSLPFEMDCNTGFQVSLTSTSAGLRTSMPNAGGMFADVIAYQARVVMPAGVNGPTCTSDAMSGACERTVRGDDLPGGVLQGSGHIALTLIPGAKPLLAGDYSDSLVMTLSPALGGPPLL